MTYDLDDIIHDVTRLSHLLDALHETISDIDCDREARPLEAKQIARASSLAAIARDLAERIGDRTSDNFARLSRPQKVAA
jgi:DNA recombination-dependent growth factor C